MKARRMPMPMLLAVLLVTLACATPTNEQFIQGSWRRSGELDGGMTYYVQWEFHQGQFVLHGYPPMRQTGHYQVQADTGNQLVLVLSAVSGDPPASDHVVTIHINRASQTIALDHPPGEPLHRVAE